MDSLNQALFDFVTTGALGIRLDLQTVFLGVLGALLILIGGDLLKDALIGWINHKEIFGKSQKRLDAETMFNGTSADFERNRRKDFDSAYDRQVRGRRHGI